MIPGVVDQEHTKGVTGWVERIREHEHAARKSEEIEESVEADLPPTELSIEEDAAREARG
jgi:ferric-dicitrate binding protein FerR (iron transport regulator)